MEEIVPILLFVGFISLVALWFANSSKKKEISQLEEQSQNNSRNFNEQRTKLQKESSQRLDLLRDTKKRLEMSDTRQRGLLALIEEKNKQFPWLATALADYQNHLGKLDEDVLRRKKHPAPKAADKVKAATQRAVVAENNFRSLKYRMDFYEKYFPWIMDVTGDTLEEFLDSRDLPAEKISNEERGDPVSKLLSQQEYSAMSSTDRNQLALDRWQKRKKSNWEIGRMYERYIGYLYEQKNYRVEYFGAVKGLDDLGRDLIVKKDGQTLIVQCKYWSTHKTIHEKHVFQLFGTVVEYIDRINSGRESLPLFDTFTQLSDIKPVFVTSTKLSDRAKDFALLLNVEVRKNVGLGDYPIIKCNISKANGERVYHMPFDQQYDRTVIEPAEGEFYAHTASDAEEKGFRRAYRWKSNQKD